MAACHSTDVPESILTIANEVAAEHLAELEDERTRRTLKRRFKLARDAAAYALLQSDHYDLLRSYRGWKERAIKRAARVGLTDQERDSDHPSARLRRLRALIALMLDEDRVAQVLDAEKHRQRARALCSPFDPTRALVAEVARA